MKIVLYVDRLHRGTYEVARLIEMLSTGTTLETIEITAISATTGPGILRASELIVGVPCRCQQHQPTIEVVSILDLI